MPTYQYNCPNGHSFQKQAGREDSEIPCPRCGKTAQRAPFVYDGLPAIMGETVAKGYTSVARDAPGGNIKDKHGRTRVSVFQEASAEIDYAHKKAENSAGRELPSPDLYKRGLQRAATENKQVRQ